MTLTKDVNLFGGERTNIFERYHLLENPFPNYNDPPRPDVCTNQTDIKKAFASILNDFGSGAMHLRINGVSGAGKTNILRYFERLTEKAILLGKLETLHPIYVSAPGDSYLSIHGQIVDNLTNAFLGELITTFQNNRNVAEQVTKEIKPAAELLEIINYITSGLGITTYLERQKNAFVNWLKGQKLSAQDKKFLGPSVIDINSTSLAIRYLDSLLQVLKKLEICKGIIVLFDEFEEIFSEALSRTAQSRYAQDLRHLFDTLHSEAFFVIATTPQPSDLHRYPAVERRLGQTEILDPISSTKQAMDYVQDYMRVGREQFFRYNEEKPDKSIVNSIEPLTTTDVEEEYQKVQEEANSAGLNVLPGFFLPVMRQRLQQIIEINQKQKSK